MQNTCFRVGVPYRLSNLSQKLNRTHKQISARRRSPIWWCSGCYSFGLKMNELPSLKLWQTPSERSLLMTWRSVFMGTSWTRWKKHIQQALNATQEWVAKNGFRFTAHMSMAILCLNPKFREHQWLCRWYTPDSPGPNKVSWDVMLSPPPPPPPPPPFKEAQQYARTECKQALNLTHLKLGGDINTLPMLYQTIDCSFQIGLWVYWVHSIKCLHTATGQHPQHWIKTGTWSEAASNQHLLAPSHLQYHEYFLGTTTLRVMRELISWLKKPLT